MGEQVSGHSTGPKAQLSDALGLLAPTLQGWVEVQALPTTVPLCQPHT